MNKYGFSLVEVIVAALILALTVGGILFIFSTEKGVVSRTGRKVQAMDFARQTLERLKNEVSAETWPVGGDLGQVGVATTDPILPGETYNEFRDKFNATRSYIVTDVNPDGGEVDYKSVTVTVGWKEPLEPE